MYNISEYQYDNYAKYDENNSILSINRREWGTLQNNMIVKL